MTYATQASTFCQVSEGTVAETDMLLKSRHFPCKSVCASNRRGSQKTFSALLANFCPRVCYSRYALLPRPSRKHIATTDTFALRTLQFALHRFLRAWLVNMNSFNHRVIVRPIVASNFLLRGCVVENGESGLCRPRKYLTTSPPRVSNASHFVHRMSSVEEEVHGASLAQQRFHVPQYRLHGP